MLSYFILILCMVLHVEALSCGPCEPETCPTISCSGSQIPGPCGCCTVCAKQLGESCGGQYDLAGRCDEGLMCSVSLEFGEAVPQQAVGICQERHPQEYLGSGSGVERLGMQCDGLHAGCNIRNGLCLCDSDVPGCQNPFEYKSQEECGKALERGATGVGQFQSSFVPIFTENTSDIPTP
ncbi:cysteine-rich motor neuron 1 protein-like [Asterias rubens]|uniref:cysteine-rich motor neuron 1 protein-like n=1 Tax=Asterias rubens TaxID=7604 RepID=UPI001455A60B|nr:cysteine-rich motor neuron 1 protein-like [Asterias rubens]